MTICEQPNRSMAVFLGAPDGAPPSMGRSSSMPVPSWAITWPASAESARTYSRSIARRQQKGLHGSEGDNKI